MELRNRFSALGSLADPNDEDPDINTKWETIKNKEVKKSTRNDKRAFLEMLACKAEWAAAIGEMGYKSPNKMGTTS